jgi:hypothetical protein
MRNQRGSFVVYIGHELYADVRVPLLVAASVPVVARSQCYTVAITRQGSRSYRGFSHLSLYCLAAFQIMVEEISVAAARVQPAMCERTEAEYVHRVADQKCGLSCVLPCQLAVAVDDLGFWGYETSGLGVEGGEGHSSIETA